MRGHEAPQWTVRSLSEDVRIAVKEIKALVEHLYIGSRRER